MTDKKYFPEVLTLKETAELLNLPLEKVYSLAERGKLPGAKVGGRWRFVRRKVLHWMRRVKKKTNRFFSRELPLVCIFFVLVFVLFHSNKLMPLTAKETYASSEISQMESLEESKMERPWWQFPGWETVFALLSCLYFIFAKYFFHHFLAR